MLRGWSSFLVCVVQGAWPRRPLGPLQLHINLRGLKSRCHAGATAPMFESGRGLRRVSRMMGTFVWQNHWLMEEMLASIDGSCAQAGLR